MISEFVNSIPDDIRTRITALTQYGKSVDEIHSAMYQASVSIPALVAYEDQLQKIREAYSVIESLLIPSQPHDDEYIDDEDDVVAPEVPVTPVAQVTPVAPVAQQQSQQKYIFAGYNPNKPLSPTDNMFFGCHVPEGFIITPYGVFRVTLKTKKDPETKEKLIHFEQERICGIPVMVTGRFVSAEGLNIVEVTFFDEDMEKRIYVSQSAVIGTKEFKEQARPQNLRVEDGELKAMLPFFNECISHNEKMLRMGIKTAYKTGAAFSTTGWKDDECTKFVAGNRMFTFENGNTVERNAICTDESLTRVFAPRGTLEGWVRGVTQVMGYQRVRFTFYSAFAAIIMKYLNVNSFTIDLYGGVSGSQSSESSSGKTTMCVIAMSGIGNINPAALGGQSLFNACDSTVNFIEATATKYHDLPVFFDESTKLDQDSRENLAYRISNPTPRGRATQNGGTQVTKPKANVALITGERPLIPSNANTGTKVRTLSVKGGIGVTGIKSVVELAKFACDENSGHILKLFLNDFFVYREELRRWFVDAKRYYEDTVTNDLSKRQANYFACIEVSGILADNVLSKIGIPRIQGKNPRAIVNEVWQASVASAPIEAQWMEALRDVWDWYRVHEKTNFSEDPKYVQQSWGWSDIETKNPVINFNTLKISEFLSSKGYDPKTIFESWREIQLTNVNKQEKKGDWIGKMPIEKTVRHKKILYKVIQVNLEKVEEMLEINEDQEA